MKKGVAIFLFIVNSFLLTLFIFKELSIIREDIRIDWKDINPYLWMFSAIVSLLVLIIVQYKKFYVLTFNSLFTIIVISLIFYQSNKLPSCELMKINYVYQGRLICGVKDSSIYQLFIKRLDEQIKSTEEDMVGVIDQILPISQLQDTTMNTLDSLVYKERPEMLSFINKYLQSLYVKDTLSLGHFWIQSEGGIYIGEPIKSAKHVDEIPVLVMKNNRYYAYRKIKINYQMVYDSAGIVVVNLGEIKL